MVFHSYHYNKCDRRLSLFIHTRLQCTVIRSTIYYTATRCCSYRQATKGANNIARVICHSVSSANAWTPAPQRIVIPQRQETRRLATQVRLLYASLFQEHAPRQPSERSVWRLRTFGTSNDIRSNDIRNANSLSAFRNNLKTHLFIVAWVQAYMCFGDHHKNLNEDRPILSAAKM